jgi:hypothetical protein
MQISPGAVHGHLPADAVDRTGRGGYYMGVEILDWRMEGRWVSRALLSGRMRADYLVADDGALCADPRIHRHRDHQRRHRSEQPAHQRRRPHRIRVPQPRQPAPQSTVALQTDNDQPAVARVTSPLNFEEPVTAAPSECSGLAGPGSTSTRVTCGGQIRRENGSQEWLPALPYVGGFCHVGCNLWPVRQAADRSAGKVRTRRVTADTKEEVP